MLLFLSPSKTNNVYPPQSEKFSAVQKKFYYKVYDTNLKYVTTWTNDVISDPTFKTVINGGTGELVVTLARKYDNFGEGLDVALQNRVELWVADSDNIANNALPDTMWDVALWDVGLWDGAVKSYQLLYAGYISQYAPVLDDKNEYVEVTFLGYITEASYKMVKDGSGNTTITYTNQDPGTIMKDLIDKYRGDGGVHLNYRANSIQLTGTTVTYTFQFVSLKDALDEIIALCPANWFYYIDNQGYVFMRQANTEKADHVLTIGANIAYSQTVKRVESVVNEVSVVGGGTPSLFTIYQRPNSITSFGKFHRKIQDTNITDLPTADKLAKQMLDYYQVPETRSVIRILDNNGENYQQGLNIESFTVGNTVQVKNLNYGQRAIPLWDKAVWDVDFWDYSLASTTASVLTIVSILYNPEYIEIEASTRLPDITKELQIINNQITQIIQADLPTAPTLRTV